MALTQQPNQGVPEIVRVKVLKGFYASVDGSFGPLTPGDVVDIPRALAFEMRAAGKCVSTEENKVRIGHYVPPYAQLAAQDPVSAQLTLLAKAVATLTDLVAGLKPAKA